MMDNLVKNLLTAAGIAAVLSLIPYAAGTNYIQCWSLLTAFIFALDIVLYPEQLMK